MGPIINPGTNFSTVQVTARMEHLLEAEGDLKAQHKDVVQDEQGLF